MRATFSSSWRHNISSLATGYPVTATDYPGNKIFCDTYLQYFLSCIILILLHAWGVSIINPLYAADACRLRVIMKYQKEYHSPSLARRHLFKDSPECIHSHGVGLRSQEMRAALPVTPSHNLADAIMLLPQDYRDPITVV